MSLASTHSGVISIRSRYSFAQTVQRLEAAFTGHGLKVFATIDQTAEAAAIGLTLRPTTLILFGNPKAGTPLMVAAPLAAMDLPLKALVIELSSDEVSVAFNSATYILDRHGLGAEFTDRLAPAEHLIRATVENEGPLGVV